MIDLTHKRDYENRLANTMMAALSIIMLSFVAMFSSCSTEDFNEPAATQSDTYINLSVMAPNTKAGSYATANGSTLGDNETNASPTAESDIHSIRVWAFKAGSGDDATPISYKEETNLNVNGSYRISMKIFKQAATDLKEIDLYILLNAESINTLTGTNNSTLTRAALKQAAISEQFGIDANGNVQNSVVDASKGLPISRAITHINIESNLKESQAEAAAHPISIPLVRAVSKLHFFFARKANAETENVEVTRIEMNGGVLPTKSSVFPEATTDANKTTQGLTGTTSSDYVQTAAKWSQVANEKITEVASPTDYVRQANEAAQTYMDRLSKAGILENHLSYLRETNKTITGTIYYKFKDNGEERSATFTIPSAVRNTEMVIYGYFLDGGKTNQLRLQYYVADWNTKQETNITFD